MLVTLDGIQSGVPTRTTSTLTPTTLRNIEQKFLEFSNDTSSSIPCQAGFVPPAFQFEPESQDYSLGSTGTNSSESWHTLPKQEISTEENSSDILSIKETTSKRNMGGRRPKNSANLSPEEEEKRRVRRERNKLAAARCRKRRVDQTNELTEKVTILESERSKLQRDIQDLQTQKEDLEMLLQTHRAHCKLQITGGLAKLVEMKSISEFKEPEIHIPLSGKIKVEVDDQTYDEAPSPTKILMSGANPVFGAAVVNPTINTSNLSAIKPLRPVTLNVPLATQPLHTVGKDVANLAGVQINTPSNVIPFNFDSLMNGGTGLTPVALPSCSSQNKSPLDLVTPTSEPSKLVSL